MLTYQIQSKSIRQTNEQVIPAALISIIFLFLAIFAMTRTFGDVKEARPSVGAWTASIEAKKLFPDKMWNWTISLEDNAGKNYIAGGSISLVPNMPDYAQKGSLINIENNPPSGYVLSSKADFSIQKNLFGENETIYLKAWSDKLNGQALKEAKWTLTSNTNDNTSADRKSDQRQSRNNRTTIDDEICAAVRNRLGFAFSGFDRGNRYRKEGEVKCRD